MINEKEYHLPCIFCKTPILQREGEKRSIWLKRKCCNIECQHNAMKQLGNTKEYKEKQGKDSAQRWKDPVFKAQMKESAKNPEHHKHRSDSAKRRAENLKKDPEKYAAYIKKISESQKKLFEDPEHKEKRVAHLKTDEAKKRVAETQQNLWKDPVWAAEQRKKRKERCSTPEGKKIMGNKMRGKHHSEETKKKVSKTLIELNKDPEYIKKTYTDTKEFRSNFSKSLWKEPEYFKTHQEAMTGENNPMYGKFWPEEKKQAASKRMKTPEKIKEFQDRMKASRYSTKNTKLEIALQNIMNNIGIEYKTHEYIDRLKPDIVIESCKLVIEADGVFFHADPRYFKPTDIVGKHGNRYTAESKWQQEKIRDIRLEQNGYKVLHFWEKEIMREPKLVEELIRIEIIKQQEDLLWGKV